MSNWLFELMAALRGFTYSSTGVLFQLLLQSTVCIKGGIASKTISKYIMRQCHLNKMPRFPES